MKKSIYITLVLSIFGILFFSLGLCMCFIEQWNMLNNGIILGIIGLVILFITLLIYRKMENMKPIKISFKTFIFCILAIFGVLLFGAGICYSILYQSFILGIALGIIGILILVSLIPLCKGLK